MVTNNLLVSHIRSSCWHTSTDRHNIGDGISYVHEWALIYLKLLYLYISPAPTYLRCVDSTHSKIFIFPNRLCYLRKPSQIPLSSLALLLTIGHLAMWYVEPSDHNLYFGTSTFIWFMSSDAIARGMRITILESFEVVIILLMKETFYCNWFRLGDIYIYIYAYLKFR